MTMDRDRIRDIVSEVVHEKLGSEADAAPSRYDDDTGYRGRALITEREVMAAHREGRPVVAPAGALVTPLARDAIERYGLEVETSGEDPAKIERVRAAAGVHSCPKGKGVVAIASDHGGFEMKQLLIEFLSSEAGITCEDLGTHSSEAVDYPDFAAAVAGKVSAGECARGIVVDGAGIGSSMVANKFKGVRSAHCSNVVEARNAREHNDANVLSLGGRMIGVELAKAIAIVFLKTDFAGGRHEKRVRKITNLER